MLIIYYTFSIFRYTLYPTKQTEAKFMNISKFTFLNQYAKTQGTVILGAGTFEAFPVNELAQDFDVKEHLYNRSAAGMTITESAENFSILISNMFPGHIIINLGETELKELADCSLINKLVEQYRWLLYKIHTVLPKTRMTITSVPLSNDAAKQFNEEIESIASEFGCDYIALPERAEGEDINEYNVALFRALKMSFYRKDMSYIDIANNAILRFS